MTNPPDRFTRAVERVAIEGNGCMVVIDDDVLKLMRREHARVVRLVKRLRNSHMVGSTRVVEEADFNYAFLAACDEILTALTARGRGKG